jgi:hypothetical protein
MLGLALRSTFGVHGVKRSAYVPQPNLHMLHPFKIRCPILSQKQHIYESSEHSDRLN